MNSLDTIEAIKPQEKQKLTRTQRLEKEAKEVLAALNKAREADAEKERKRQRGIAKRARDLAKKQAKKDRDDLTRRKILVGVAYLNEVERNPAFKSQFESILARHITEDRNIQFMRQFGHLQHPSAATAPTLKE